VFEEEEEEEPLEPPHIRTLKVENIYWGVSETDFEVRSHVVTCNPENLAGIFSRTWTLHGDIFV
jgi:hypothetical protein